MSHIFTLEDEGFRRLGPLHSNSSGLSTNRLLELFNKHGSYEIEGSLIRHKSRKKGKKIPTAIEIVNTFSNEDEIKKNSLDFIDDHYSSFVANTGLPELQADSKTTLLNLIDAAEKETNRCRSIELLQKVLAFAGKQKLGLLFKNQIAPCFFRMYPKGKIVIIKYNENLNDISGIQKMLYAFSQSEISDLTLNDFQGIKSLQNWHSNSLVELGPLYLEVLNYIFYPFVQASRGGPPGLDFYFIFDPPEEFKPENYTKNWHGKARSIASFGTEKFDIFEAIENYGGPKWKQATHQRFLHSKYYSSDEFLILLHWYLEKANRHIFELTDICNFTKTFDNNVFIDPVFGFEHLITIDRLLRKTILSITLEDVGTARSMVFEIAELYETISKLFKPKSNAADFFKKLFNPKFAPPFLGNCISQLPSPFDSDLQNLLNKNYSSFQEKIISSIWIKTKIEKDLIKVKTKSLKGEERVDFSVFVSELMRSFRNTHHGYFTRSDKDNNRPTRYLYMVDGNLPNEMVEFPATWWLAYLSNPSYFGWNYLGVDYS